MKVERRADHAVSETSCKSATGKSLADWFKVLDKHGGAALGRRLLTNWLLNDQKVEPWWSSTIVAEYEIARGDLAVECGYVRLAELQEEILWLCEAAHLPVIWATQVLDQLARTGRPSRAEITDAAMGERAECVMLNKGPHVVEAIGTLDEILHRMGGHHYKKTALLRPLRSWGTPDA